MVISPLIGENNTVTFVVQTFDINEVRLICTTVPHIRVGAYEANKKTGASSNNYKWGHSPANNGLTKTSHNFVSL